MRSLKEILRESDSPRAAALRAWEQTHEERGCKATAVRGRCHCTCPDHRCVDIYEPDTGDVQCWTCRDERVVRLSGLSRDDPRFGRAQPCPACTTPEDQEEAAVQHNSPTLAMLEAASLSDVYPPERQAVLREWLTDFSPPTVTLYGEAGTGKSFAAIAVGREAAQRMRVEFTTAVALLDEIRACYAPHAQTEVEEVLRRLRSVGLLIIDDLGAHRDSGHTEEKLLQIVNERQSRHHPTIVTTNLTEEEMGQDRLRSRLFGQAKALVVSYGGADRRRQ